MIDLASSTCEACRIDAPKVSDDEASLLIKEIEGWDVIDEGVKKGLKAIRLNYINEPLIRRDIIDFIKYAKKKRGT